MSNNFQDVLVRLEKLTYEEGQNEFGSLLLNDLSLNQKDKIADGIARKAFLKKLITEIDSISNEIKVDNTKLVSVKHQKLLRTSFQIITSLGVSPCLIPGVGISLLKKCSTAAFLPLICMTDEEKYKLLVECTEFFTRCYSVPVLKNIIIAYHLSDYLASLIQLSFAPLKKPGSYGEFTMTKEMYEKLNHDRKSYSKTYNSLVANCFQPIIMKELLVLQGVTNPSPPAFVKRVIAKEMSKRLLNPGGLLSLIRCFIESYEIDTGYEWKKIDMITKIVSSKHGTSTESDYLLNMCSQIAEVLLLKNTHYLTTAVACVLSLKEKYPDSDTVTQLYKGIFQVFDYNNLTSQDLLPGTILLSPQEVEQGVTILHAAVCSMNLNIPAEIMSSNMYLLFHLGIKCTKNQEMKIKIKDVILKCFSACNKLPVEDTIKLFLFGCDRGAQINVEEFDAGVALHCVETNPDYDTNDALLYFLELFRGSAENSFVESVFGASLQILVCLTKKRQSRGNNDLLLLENNPEILDKTDQQYAVILQLLTEISTSPKVMNLLKTNPSTVLEFIEYFLLKTQGKSDEECVTIALVLLNMLLSNSSQASNAGQRFYNLLPVLRKMAEDTATLNSILGKEAIALISSEHSNKAETACEKAIADVFDDLLPVRAHGIIALTKLIDAKDPETISKKHYLFCIFQDQLKDQDSYIYLSSINGIAALGAHCTEDVLHLLCQEFLKTPDQQETEDTRNKAAELRMKVGDVIVKVTRRLGEMAVVHKTILLNTVLGACRDDDPLIRTSALSNLAEIALVLHYKIGSIIYEILLCIWGILETDKAIECRRAAVMVISSLLRGLGSETLTQLKENLLPLYRTLKRLYNDPSEDTVVKLHSQIALEELNDIVNQFLFPELKTERQIYVLDSSEDFK